MLFLSITPEWSQIHNIIIIIILLFKEMVNINTQKQQKAWKETKIILDNKTKTKTETKYASNIATSKWEINDQNGSLM